MYVNLHYTSRSCGSSFEWWPQRSWRFVQYLRAPCSTFYQLVLMICAILNIRICHLFSTFQYDRSCTSLTCQHCAPANTRACGASSSSNAPFQAGQRSPYITAIFQARASHVMNNWYLESRKRVHGSRVIRVDVSFIRLSYPKSWEYQRREAGEFADCKRKGESVTAMQSWNERFWLRKQLATGRVVVCSGSYLLFRTTEMEISFELFYCRINILIFLCSVKWPIIHVLWQYEEKERVVGRSRQGRRPYAILR